MNQLHELLNWAVASRNHLSEEVQKHYNNPLPYIEINAQLRVYDAVIESINFLMEQEASKETEVVQDEEISD